MKTSKFAAHTVYMSQTKHEYSTNLSGEHLYIATWDVQVIGRRSYSRRRCIRTLSLRLAFVHLMQAPLLSKSPPPNLQHTSPAVKVCNPTFRVTEDELAVEQNVLSLTESMQSPAGVKPSVACVRQCVCARRSSRVTSCNARRSDQIRGRLILLYMQYTAPGKCFSP